MPPETLHLQRIASDHPVLELSDGTRWQVPAGISFMLIQSWDIGDEIKVTRGRAGVYDHQLRNVALSAGEGITAAKQVKDWPEEE